MKKTFVTKIDENDNYSVNFGDNEIVDWKYTHPGGGSNGFDNRYTYDGKKFTPMK